MIQCISAVCAHNCQVVRREVPDFIIVPNLWLFNIQDFSPVDYRMLAMLQEWICQHLVWDVDKFRQRLSDMSVCHVWIIATPCWPVFQLLCWHRSSESCTQRHAPFWISSRVTVWLQLFESCTGCQLLRGSGTSCACWFTSRFWDTRRNTSQTFWCRLPIFQVDLHYVPHRVATSLCRRHVDELATEPFLLLHREHGTGYRWSWNCCDRRTCFIAIWKHFCFILSTGTRIRIDSVMHPWSSSRGHNTSASVTVTDRWSLIKRLVSGILAEVMSYGHRWTLWTFDIIQCFTIALHCWSIHFHTLYDVSFKFWRR